MQFSHWIYNMAEASPNTVLQEVKLIALMANDKLVEAQNSDQRIMNAVVVLLARLPSMSAMTSFTGAVPQLRILRSTSRYDITHDYKSQL